MKGCKTIAELQKVWGELSAQEKKQLESLKGEIKKKIAAEPIEGEVTPPTATK